MAKENNNLVEKIFKIKSEIDLTDEESEYLEELNRELVNIIDQEGEVGDVKIKEIVLDDLLRKNLKNLISYLSLDIEDNIKKNIDDQLNSNEFLKVENADTNEDFFQSYLKDTKINDLIMSLKGYERKAEGSKEIFIKKRKALIPTEKIEAISRIFVSKFNETEFKSEKDDNEQAHMIMFILDQIFEILLEIPYDMCNTEKTIEIMTMCSTKLMNAVGLSNQFRTQLMETLKESYKAQRNQNTNQQPNMIMQ